MTNADHNPERDAAATPPRLSIDAIEKPLAHLENYEIADGFPDISGWELYGSDGHQLGSVTELLADAGSRHVTQAVVDVDGRKTSVPIEFIHLDEAASRVFVSDEGVERTSLRQASSGRGMASPTLKAARGDGVAGGASGREQLDIGIRRRSEAAPQDQPCTSMQQDLAPGQTMDTPVFRDGEIRVPIIEEEVVIEKRKDRTGTDHACVRAPRFGR